MKKSNLSQEILKKIWSISSKSKHGLIEEEFYIVLRLIALAQNNFPFSEEEIEKNSPIPPLPKFDNFIQRPSNINIGNNDEDDDPTYQIPHNNLILYKQYFENNKDSKLYYISTKKAVEMWIRNDNKKFNIDKVANSLKPLEKKGYLNLKEFQVACHLLSICNHIDIPIPLPNCLLKFLGRPLIANRPKKEYNKINSNENDSNSNNRMQGYNGEIQNFNSEEIKQNSNEDLETEDIKEFINDNRKNDEINVDKNMENLENIAGYKEENNKEKINNENLRSSYKINEVDNLNNLEVNKFQNSDNNHEFINNDDLSKIMKRLEILEKNNDINNNIKNNNDALLKKIDELEEKNKEANKKISSLESEVDSLKKEKNKMNKELNQLKQMFLSMKTKIDSLNVQKMNNPFKAENTINQKERFKTLNSVENSKKKLKNNLELINDEQYNNIIPRNTLENNDINYLNNKDKNFNNKKIPLDGDDRNNSKK
jgi:hypothetical protein